MNMDWLFEPFRHGFMQRALFGCALIGFTNGALSSFIVIRRLALMADAMAHSLLPGVAVALILFGLMPATLFVGALLAALLVAFGTQIISNSSRIKEDTALGLLFACSFSLGLVLISLSSVRVNVSDYLFGNILGLGDADLWIIYLISLVALPVLVALERPLLLTMFEPAVASSQGVPVNSVKYLLIGLLVLAMISSLQAVGVILALGRVCKSV
jgi:manganese transport system permease protein